MLFYLYIKSQQYLYTSYYIKNLVIEMVEKTFGKYELNKEQSEWLSKKQNDKYSGYGSFIGMVMNQTYEYSGGLDKFGEFLKNAINIQILLEKTREEFSENMKEEKLKETEIERQETEQKEMKDLLEKAEKAKKEEAEINNRKDIDEDTKKMLIKALKVKYGVL